MIDIRSPKWSTQDYDVHIRWYTWTQVASVAVAVLDHHGHLHNSYCNCALTLTGRDDPCSLFNCTAMQLTQQQEMSPQSTVHYWSVTWEFWSRIRGQRTVLAILLQHHSHGVSQLLQPIPKESPWQPCCSVMQTIVTIS